MKKTVVFLLFLLCAVAANAQLTLSTNVTFNPDPDIFQWASQPNTVTITVTNTGSATIQYKISGYMLLDGARVVDNDPAKMPIETIGPFETVVRFAEDLFPEGAVNLYGDLKETYLRSNQMPGGFYQICAVLTEANGTGALTNEVCRPFQITSYQQPSLIFPTDKSAVFISTPPIFSWTPITPTPSYNVIYRLKVFELPEETANLRTNPIQTFSYGFPMIDVEVSNQTQWLWTPEYPEPRIGKSYIWSVQAIKENDQTIGSNNGIATPFTFRVTENSNVLVDNPRAVDIGVPPGNNPNASSQGTVMIVGIDTEFGSRPSNITHGSIADWCNIINTGLLANVTNGKSGIVVIGGGKRSSNDVKDFWGQVASCLGTSVTYKHRKGAFNSISQIKSVDFNDYALVVVPTDHSDVSGSLVDKELKALNDRKNDVADFLCGGGALFASSCELSNPYDYMAKFGAVSTSSGSYSDITPTPAGALMGITNTNLDKGPWHITFSSFPPYLIPLAHNTSGSVAAIGGQNVSKAKPDFTLPKTIFCLNEDIIADASLSSGAVNYFWSVQESDINWNRFGPEITQWFTGPPSTTNLSSFVGSKGFSFKCNTYYRVKLAVTSLCGDWIETSKLIKISCPDVTAGLDRCVSCTIDGTSVILGQGNSISPLISYSWVPSNGLNNSNNASPVHQSGSVSYPTTYTVIATDNTGCTSSDQVTLFCTKPVLDISKTITCCNININSNAQNYSTITWSNGSTGVASIDVNSAGTYSVTATNACGSVTQQITVTGVDASLLGALADIIAPNAFTPDGDGKNDYFQLIHFGPNAPPMGTGPAYNATDYRLTIFDRWGGAHIVATGSACPGFVNGEIKWDGKINNTLVQGGVYEYLLEMKNCRFVEWKTPNIYNAKYKCVDCKFSLTNWSCSRFKKCAKYELTNELQSSIRGSVTVVR